MKKTLLLALLLAGAALNAPARQAQKPFFPADNSADRLDTYDELYQKEQCKTAKRRFKQLRAEVRGGYAESARELAWAYYRGEGVKKNDKKAYKYMQKAAQAGDAGAAVMQGVMLAHGKGVRQNLPLACAIFKELVQNDNPHAMFQLYRLASGCSVSDEEQQRMLDTSARRGVAPALYEKSLLTSNAPEQAFRYMEQAARLEYRPAQYALARMFEAGNGTEINPAKAFDYMLLAAKQNLQEAQWQTAQWYEAGYGVKKSLPLSFHWTRNAAKNGVKEAQKRLAEMYRTGYGVPVNAGQARKWEKKAAANEQTAVRQTKEEFY